jgi:hypothetical protein
MGSIESLPLNWPQDAYLFLLNQSIHSVVRAMGLVEDVYPDNLDGGQGMGAM